jgi:hypothetical protein
MIRMTIIERIKDRIYFPRERLQILFSYAACLYMVEILYNGAKIILVYGSIIGLAVTALLTIVLSILILGSHLRYTITVFILLLLYGIHCALSLVSAATVFYPVPLDIPIWLLVYRVLLIPFEIMLVLSFIIEDKNTNE